jgi:hypothetical protein
MAKSWFPQSSGVAVALVSVAFLVAHAPNKPI